MSSPNVRSAITLGLVLMVAAGCRQPADSGTPTGPSPQVSALPVLAETADYVFRAAPGDSIDTAWQERYHRWLTETLGEPPRTKITYNKYTSRWHMQTAIGVGTTNAWADPGGYAIHTIWPIDNHEVVHLLTSQWGSPVALINEGLAVAFQVDPSRDATPRWSGTSIHELTRQFRSQGRYVPLSTLVETSTWRAQDSNVAYPESGSFLRWLIDRHGIGAIRTLYARAGGTNAPASTVRAAFAAVYGQSLDALEDEWLAFLAPRDAAPPGGGD